MEIMEDDECCFDCLGAATVCVSKPRYILCRGEYRETERDSHEFAVYRNETRNVHVTMVTHWLVPRVYGLPPP